MEQYILSIDQSTQGTKAMLFDAAGQLTARTDRPHRQYVNAKGWVSHDLEEIRANTLAAARDLLQKAEIRPDQIAAVGLSNQRETVAAWHRETGAPVCSAIVWQCARARELCDGLTDQAELVRARTGIPLSPYFSAPKMAWILQNVPGAAELAAENKLCLGTMDSFLVYQLTEEKAFKTDYSNASRTQLFNIHTLAWDEELCILYVVPRACLPEVCMSDSLFGHTTLGGLLDKPVPLCGVLGDSHAALLGQNCRAPGQTKATYGTGSSVMMQTGERLVTSRCGLVTSLAWGLDGRVEYVLEGNLNYTGAVITWLKKDAALLDSDGESERLARLANPADKTYFVPAFTGLGAPYWDSGATGLLTGITRTTGKAEIVKACLESIGYQITDLVLRMAQDAGLALAELRVDGGPTANSYLMQFQSDMARVEVSVPEIQELSGFGAACAAGFACGFYDPAVVHGQMRRHSYLPRMKQAERDARYAGWQSAVRQTLTHD